jgi:Ni,Fe-hydrogenase III large subunit
VSGALWQSLWDRAAPLPGAGAVRCLRVDAAGWLAAASDAAAAEARLLSLWAVPGHPDTGGTSTAAGGGARGGEVQAALLHEADLLLLQLPWPDPQARWPSLAQLFPVAARLQRAAADLTGLACDAADQRPWLRHDAASEAYDFVRVSGEGVHEVPVGPVHAGIIEPGHFHFSIVGEKVLRLEQRLGYAHKGVTRRFSELPALAAHPLAARTSGDSAVAGSWAYCQALESLAGSQPPARALWLRALALELERAANHLGDLGALGNDAGFAFALAQYSRLKERLLRATEAALGARYLLDFVVPGGVARDLDPDGSALLAAELAAIAPAAAGLATVLDEHAGVRDRYVGTGVLAPALALRLGVLGLAARASGIALDLRQVRPWAPYETLPLQTYVEAEGDVAARVSLRSLELQAACRLAGWILERLPAGELQQAVTMPGTAATGIGLIEGWRGPTLVVLECNAAGGIRHCQVHDSSWQAWPALEHAVIGNIVPDFPLINKSFNLSYSGHDL